MAPLYPSFTDTYHHEQYPAIDPTQKELDCSEKVVVITGGGRGIGKAIAVAFAKAHAKGIVLMGRTRSTLETAAAEVHQRFAIIPQSFPGSLSFGPARSSSRWHVIASLSKSHVAKRYIFQRPVHL